ncbi:MAG: protease pro-enzyme activation domain-containing protein [Acidobacteriaceae bacterium]
MPNSPKVALQGSEREPMQGAKMVGPADPNKQMEVSVILRRRQALNLDELGGRTLSPDEFAKTYGADPADIKRMHDFAAAHHLKVASHKNEIATRTMKLSGTVAAMEKAFGVTLHKYDGPQGSYRGREGMVHIPQDCAGMIEAVLGLDDRPQAKPHFRWLNGAPPAAQPRASNVPAQGTTTQAAADQNPAKKKKAVNVSYTPVQVAQLYDFPTGGNGGGETIGIIELGGGYNPSDIQQYFQQLGLTPPSVTAVSVDGGMNQPTTANSADAEVLLDIEVSGGVAPGAKIVVYFASNTDQGLWMQSLRPCTIRATIPRSSQSVGADRRTRGRHKPSRRWTMRRWARRR